MVEQCYSYLKENEDSIRKISNKKLPPTLNGPEGKVASKTIISVKMVATGLKRLNLILVRFNYADTNLLSCLTIDVEHFHAATHIKEVVMSMRQYCVQFGNTLKETIKRVTKWGGHYYTGGKNWYPIPDGAINFEDMPIWKKDRPIRMEKAKVEVMRNWASIHGKAVRQKSNRQQATMASAGTLSSNLYEIRSTTEVQSVS